MAQPVSPLAGRDLIAFLVAVALTIIIELLTDD